jgi:chaperonin GroES
MAKNTKDKSKSREDILPLGDRVLIELPPREEKTVSGIIIPETVSDERADNRRGVVVAVGEGKYEDGKRVPMGVKKGDRVLFQWGEKVEIDEKEYYIVSENNILAVIV